jgi:RimJ/RimL family protein N-acetyltransferase
MTTLLTSRLRLRPFRPSDTSDLAAQHLDPETMRYFTSGAAGGAAEAMRRAEAQVAAYADHWAAHGYGVWALEWRTDGKFAGRVGLRLIEELRAVELLYLIVRPHWGQGLASEAAEKALEFGFTDRGMVEIIALAMPGNAASQRVMAKIGMRREGEAHVWGHDLVRYATRREDFSRDRPIPPPG